MKRPLLALIRYYQRAVSPSLPAACKYQPSCSHYAYDAIDRFGAVRGSYLAARRLLRCTPWRAGGFDPVPASKETVSMIADCAPDQFPASVGSEHPAPAGRFRI